MMLKHCISTNKKVCLINLNTLKLLTTQNKRLLNNNQFVHQTSNCLIGTSRLMARTFSTSQNEDEAKDESNQQKTDQEGQSVEAKKTKQWTKPAAEQNERTRREPVKQRRERDESRGRDDGRRGRDDEIRGRDEGRRGRDDGERYDGRTSKPQIEPKIVNAKIYSQYIKVQDQLSQLKELQSASVKSGEVLQANVEEIKSSLQADLLTEKKKYLENLEAQEQQLKKNTTRRVFALVDEIEQVKQKENQILDQQITEKRQGVQSTEKAEPEKQHDKQVQRKEILVMYQNLKSKFFDKDTLQSVVKNFKLQDEKTQREIFKSLKIQNSRQLAIAELLQLENNTYSKSNLQNHLKNAQDIQGMIKQILPQYFKEEYLSLKQIKDRKANVDKIFQKAEATQIEKLDQIQQVQQSLSKFDKEVTQDSVRNQIADLLLNSEDPSKVQTFDQFKVTRQTIHEVKDALSKLQFLPITDADRQAEKMNQGALSKAEYDAVQTKKFVTMLNNLQRDLFIELRNEEKSTVERQKKLENPEMAADKQIKVIHQNKKNADLLIWRLRKYEVDKNWFQAKTTEQLQELTNEYQKEMNVRAQILASEFMTEESVELQNIMHRLQKEKDATPYLASRLKVFTKANGIEDDVLTENVQKCVENMLQHNYNVPLVTNDYRTSEALFQKVQAPSKSIFDNFTPAKSNNFDCSQVEDLLSYNEYKIKQIHQLNQEDNKQQTESLLIEKMTTIKRDAWLNIYNDFLEYQDRNDPTRADKDLAKPQPVDNEHQFAKVSSKEDFFELFRDWQFREMIPGEGNEATRQYLLNRDEVTVDEHGNRVLNANIDMDKVNKEMRDEAQKHVKQMSEMGDYSTGQIVQGVDPEYYLMEAENEELAKNQKVFKELVSVVEKDKGGKMTDPKVFSQEEIDIYNTALGMLESAKKEFRDKWGEDVFDDSIIRMKDSDVICEHNFERYGTTQDREKAILNHKRSNEEANNEADSGDITFARNNVQMINDALVKQIEAHLAGVSRLSDEYGIDHLYEIDKKRRDEQIFDERGYSEYKEAETLEKMSQYDRQQELLFRRKVHQIQVKREIEELAKIADEETKMNNKIGKIFPFGRELYEKLQENHVLQGKPAEAFDRVVKNIGRDFKKTIEVPESLDGQLMQRIQSDEAAMRKSEGKKEFKELDMYRSIDKFGSQTLSHEQTEDSVMKHMAANFEPFEVNKVVSHELATSFTQGHSHSLKDSFSRAQSSSQIINASASQKLSPEDQKLANVYRNDNLDRETYLQTKYQMFVNEQIRAQLAEKILNAQDILKHVKDKHQNITNKADEFTHQFSSDVYPKKHFDFMQMENIRDLTTKSAFIAKRLQQFNPKSTNIENYNEELRLHLNVLSYNKLPSKRKTVLEQIAYIKQQIKKNGVQANVDTNALVFSIALTERDIEQANLYLKRVQLAGTVGHSPISVSRLEEFFTQSIQRDNFDGLAYLVSYLETNQINIQNWNLQKFRSALNFYLNHSFNLNKIMTFTRFYVHQASGAIAAEAATEGLSEQESVQMFERVFGSLESLVDMNALFGHLVEKVGSKTFIDPITKQDPLVKLIEFFSRKDVQQICKLSNEGTTFINSTDMANYSINHFTEPRSFTQVSTLVQRIDTSPHGNDLLVIRLLQGLNNYQAKSGSLPKSFTEENIRNFYIQVKQDKNKISEKTAEFFLFLFKSKNMVAETIDLCEQYHTLVKGFESPEQAKRSDIRSYYMSESIFSHPGVATNFNNLVQNAVFQDRTEGAAYVSSMAKSYMKDGNVDYALSFFENQIQQRRQVKENEEAELIKLFNSTFGETKSQVDINNFKDKYLQMMLVREQTKKELAAIASLEQILHNCDQNELDNLFLLQIVMNEERQLLTPICNDTDYHHVSTNLENLQTKQELQDYLSQFHADESLVDELMIIKSRKVTLNSVIKYQNKLELLKVMEVMQDGKVKLMEDVLDMDDALVKVGLTRQEYSELVSYDQDKRHHSQVLNALKAGRGIGKDSDMLHSDVYMSEFNKTLENAIKNGLYRHERLREQLQKEDLFGNVFLNREEYQERTGENIIQVLEDLEDREEDDEPLTDEQVEAIRKYRKYLYEEDFTEQNDKFKGVKDEEKGMDSDEEKNQAYLEEDMIVQNAYEDLISGTSDQVAEAFESRKKKSLGMLLKTFNKVQGIQFKKFGQNLMKNPKTFSQSEIQAIAKQNHSLVKPSKAVQSNADIADFKDSNGMININSPAAKELDRRRLEEGYFLDDEANISSTIDEFSNLLHDQKSPIISNFIHLMNYKNGTNMVSQDQFNELEDQGMILIDEYNNHAEVMEKQIQKVDQMIAGMHDLKRKIDGKDKKMQESKASLDTFYNQWTENKSQKVDHVISSKIEALHSQFNKLVTKNEDSQLKLQFNEQSSDSSVYHRTLSDSDKLQIMRQALSVDVGSYRPFEIFNSFYSEDLIMFGMKNKIPEAVRLGEKMMNENGESLSYEVAKAVKQYKLKNNQQYQEAIKKTGPIDFASVYKNAHVKDSWSRNSIVNMDDPYWVQFMEKNYRAQDFYKIPSAMAWDYNPNGILDEVIDMKSLEKKVNQINQMM